MTPISFSPIAFGMSVRRAKDVIKPDREGPETRVVARKPKAVRPTVHTSVKEPTPEGAMVFTHNGTRYFADGTHRTRLEAAGAPLQAFLDKKAALTGKHIDAEAAEADKPSS
jgi:hypothetical protein